GAAAEPFLLFRVACRLLLELAFTVVERALALAGSGNAGLEVALGLFEPLGLCGELVGARFELRRARIELAQCRSLDALLVRDLRRPLSQLLLPLGERLAPAPLCV